jgi:hypothetical protein
MEVREEHHDNTCGTRDVLTSQTVTIFLSYKQAAPGGKQCEQRWDGNTGQSKISYTDQRQASPKARLHRLTVYKDCHAAKKGP